MPLVNKIATKVGRLAIWEISENLEELITQFQFTNNEKTEFEQIKAAGRKKEYLVSRLLLNDLLGCKSEIFHSKCGKPNLLNCDMEISISHCQHLVTVIISKQRVGIDVENTTRNIDRIAKRFLHDDEATHIKNSKNPQVEKVLYWSAKEAVFKCSEKEGILFNEQIYIHPFGLKESGEYRATLRFKSEIENFNLWYFFYKNNVITYCAAN